MLKYNRTIWKMREVFAQLTANKLRFILTVVGIAVGTFMYFLFSILTYSYIQSAYEKYGSFAENTMLINGELSNEEYMRVDEFFADWPNVNFYSCDSQQLLQFSVNEKTTNVIVGLTCTDNPCTSIAVPGSNTDIVNRTQIVAGRDFETSNFQSGSKVVVIPELAAQLLFQSESPIGKSIELSIGDYGPSAYTIVGVYMNTPDEMKAIRLINSKKSGDDVQISLQLYAPITALTKSEQEYISRCYSVYYSKDIDQLYNRAKMYFEGYEYVGIYTKQSHFRALKELNSSVSGVISAVMLIIMLISGISISNSMIFSIRERIPEIGIRKTFGADGADIVARFVFEGAMTALVGALFAILAAVMILIGAKYYLKSQIEPLLTIHYSWTILVKTICFVLLEGVIGSILPAVYAARIQIADAIRFD